MIGRDTKKVQKAGGLGNLDSITSDWINVNITEEEVRSWDRKAESVRALSRATADPSSFSLISSAGNQATLLPAWF